ncbi:MAG: hypothetical protein AAGA56_04025 [Myxococcota bacterium]
MLRPISSVFLLGCLLAACAGPVASTDEDNDDDRFSVSDEDDDSPDDGPGASDDTSCAGSGFASESTALSLPDYGVDTSGDPVFRLIADDVSCPGGGTLRYQVMNLDGDALPDLLVTTNCSGDDATGRDRWRLHRGESFGFAAEPTPWSLPDYGVGSDGQPLFTRAAWFNRCPGGGSLRHQLVNLTGAAAPDLLITENCDADETTGATSWRLHRNTGSGFAAEPTVWSLPNYGVDASGNALFTTTADNASCPGGGTLRYQLLDLDGDARPDLVVSENCIADETTGASSWRVHLNTGTGFAEEAIQWELPNYGVTSNGSPMFELVADWNSCPGGGAMRYQLLDLTGDRRPDLVVSENCEADAETGSTSWRLHENTGTGFSAEARPWRLPNYGVDASGESLFTQIVDSNACPGEGVVRHQIIDLVGDARPDLVISENCAADVETGAASWRVHENEGTGFADEAYAWGLPSYGVDADGNELFSTVAGSPLCPAEGRVRFQLLEFNGDGKADFLVSENCSSDAATGSTQWRLHLTECE